MRSAERRAFRRAEVVLLLAVTEMADRALDLVEDNPRTYARAARDFAAAWRTLHADLVLTTHPDVPKDAQ